AWQQPSTRASGDAAGLTLDGSASALQPGLATSPRIRVVRNRECVLELRTALTRGRVNIVIWWRNSTSRQLEYAQVVSDPRLPLFGSDGRTFLRATPRSEEVWI